MALSKSVGRAVLDHADVQWTTEPASPLSVRDKRFRRGRAGRLLGAVATLSLAICAIAPATARAEPSDGRVSAFYRWTGVLPSRPGTLLRSEPMEPALVPYGAAFGRRILYGSTDGIGGKSRVAVSGALYLPRGRPPAGGWPVVAWAHGTVGVADICAPSWAGRSWRDVNYLSAWLEQGFAVVATDYQGLGAPGPHPYLATRPEGYSVLDAARAVVRGRRDLANKIVLVGQSQGGGAVIAAAGLAPAYAPDLHVVATVATGAGPVYARAPQPAAARSPEIDATSAYALYLSLSMMAVDPSIKPDQLLSPRALSLLPLANSRCIDALEGDILLAHLNWDTVLAPTALAALARKIDLVAFPSYAIPTPVFMGTGALDIDVDPARQRELAGLLCKANTRVEHHVYAGLDHSEAVNASLADSIPFVRRMIAGGAPASTCPKVL